VKINKTEIDRILPHMKRDTLAVLNHFKKLKTKTTINANINARLDSRIKENNKMKRPKNHSALLE
tara:strand:+ start:121 stop:315 length:195 start_codon:yes stop_codon:yes gene_type:complete